MSNDVPPGWYPDGQGGERWWDGGRWTEHTRGAAPAAPAAPVQAAPQTPPAQSYGGAPAQGYGAPAQGYGGAPGPGFGSGGPGYGPGGGFPPPGKSGGGKGLWIGLISGVVVLAVALTLVLVFVVGGDGGNGDDGGDSAGPSAAVKTFFEDARDRDCAVFDAYSDELLDQFAEFGADSIVSKEACEENPEEFFGDSDSGAGCDIETSNEEVDGDDATVDVEITGCDDPDDNSDGSQNLTLVKVDGEWKINAIPGSESSPGSTDSTPGTTSTSPAS